MSKKESPFFERGKTFYGPAVPDSAALQGVDLEGREFEMEDYDYASTARPLPLRTRNTMVRVRIVRNVSGISLLPKRLARFTTTAGAASLTRVDGYGYATADAVVAPIDEFLPAAGVQNNDLFYVVMDGPCLFLTDLAGAANNVINVGGVLVALTAASSQATTAGRVAPQDLTGATALLGAQIQNRLGRALSAKTTANTNADVLVNFTGRF